MSDATEVVEYSSPVGKLLRVFHRSRAGWKRKCQAAKQANKLLQNQVRAVERSREKWKRDAREYQRRIAELEAELQKTG
jgi:hypothetical protein